MNQEPLDCMKICLHQSQEEMIEQLIVILGGTNRSVNQLKHDHEAFQAQLTLLSAQFSALTRDVLSLMSAYEAVHSYEHRYFSKS